MPAVVLLAMALSVAPAPRPAADRPSVVLITLDTTRADRLGCYGRRDAGTPNLDRLAASGVRFADAWSPAPITLPSHLSILTGCTPPTHGVRDNGGGKFDGHVPTLATRFTAAGYRTAAVVSASVLDSTWGASAGFAVYDDRLDMTRERKAAAATARALEILGPATEPYFLWVHYYDPHFKYDPPAPFSERFKDDPYQGEIAFVDFELGRLLAALDKLARKPIVVVAADHGEALGEHGERTHGILTYRSTLRVPLLVAGPGIPAGRVVADPVSLVDIAPTVAELAGLPAAKLQDGVSLAGVVRRAATAPPSRALYFESMLPLNSYGWVPPRGLTDGRYTYIELPKREVYDLRSDPDQAKNLYSSTDPLSASLARRFDTLTAGLAKRASQGAPATLTDEQRAKLSSLGYFPGAAPASPAATLDPKDVIDLADKVERAMQLHVSGRDEEAIAMTTEILRRNPENVRALSIRGQALLAQKHYREAASAFAEVVAKTPTVAVNRWDLGTSLAGAGETEKAEAEWRKAIDLEPHLPEPRASLIASLRGRGETAKAVVAAKEAATSGAESPELDFEIGLAHEASADVVEAQRWYESTVRLRPSHAQALSHLGKIAADKGRTGEALARYRAALAAARDARERAELAAKIAELTTPAGK